MRNVLRALIGVAFLALAACTTAGGPGTESTTAYPADYKTDLLALARQFSEGAHKIKDAGISEPVLKQTAQGERYIVCARFNPAGADGKFLGMKGGVGIFWFGKLDQVAEVPMDAARTGAPNDGSPAGLCRDAIYRPFPELEKL